MASKTLRTLELAPASPDSAVRITADILAGDSPALVYLHGMTSDRMGAKGEAILAVARERGKAFARFDFRGHGDSDGEFGEVTMTDLVADVAAVVDHVGPCVLIGSSMGGLAAAWYTARHPAHVVALAMLSPALGYLPEMAKQAGDFELIRGDAEAVSLREAVLADARNYDEAALPGAIRVPVFLAHGTADRTVPPELSDAFCRGLPHRNKEFWLIEGGSHSLNEDLDEIVPRLVDFLEDQHIL